MWEVEIEGEGVQGCTDPPATGTKGPLLGGEHYSMYLTIKHQIPMVTGVIT